MISIVGLLVMYFSTMPGHRIIEAALIDGGFLQMFEPLSTGIRPRESLVSYHPLFSLTLFAMFFWPMAFGVFAANCRHMTNSRVTLVSLAAFIILLSGKALDLAFEGRLFTGNYFALGSALVLLESIRLGNATPKD